MPSSLTFDVVIDVLVTVIGLYLLFLVGREIGGRVHARLARASPEQVPIWSPSARFRLLLGVMSLYSGVGYGLVPALGGWADRLLSPLLFVVAMWVLWSMRAGRRRIH